MSVADFCGSYLQVNFPQNKKKPFQSLYHRLNGFLRHSPIGLSFSEDYSTAVQIIRRESDFNTVARHYPDIMLAHFS